MATPAAQPLTPAGRATVVKARARALGFAAVGITDLRPTAHADALDRWLAQGRAGAMAYMHRQAARRKEPARIVPEATRAVVVLYNYGTSPEHDPVSTGRIARYARGPDYHHGLRPALEALAGAIRTTAGAEGTFARPYVDAGPVPERELAQRAGLGWIGKNTMLIDPARGSFTLLAVILTNADLAVDVPFAADRCGSCTRCLDACPTGAFPEPRVLDATRCISYLTIEHRGPLPIGRDLGLAGWIFGCDVCQEVCPWNEKFSTTDEDVLLRLDTARGAVPLDAFDEMDETAFAREFGWTPLERPGLDGMRRNARALRDTA